MYQKIIKFSIYALVFLLPLFFLPFTFEAFEFNKQYILFFLVSLAFLAWLAKMVLIDKELRFKRSPLDIFILAFLSVNILSVVFSVNKFSSLFGFYGRFSDGLMGIISLVILYFLIINNITIKSEASDQKFEINSNGQDYKLKITAPNLIRIFSWSVFLAVLLGYFSIFGLWQRINTFIPLPAMMLQNIFNPVAGSLEGLAVFLASIVVLFTGIILSCKKIKKWEKIGAYVLLAAVLGLLIIINFNPAWLIVLLGLILFLFIALWKRMFREEINKLLLPILIVVLSFIFLFIGSSDIQKLIPGDYLPQEQVLGQNISWQVGLRSATENVKSFFLGSGTGTWHYGFAKFRPMEFNQTNLWQIRFDRAGSHMAELLGTTGFLGLLSFLFLTGMFFLISWFIIGSQKSQLSILMIVSALFIGQFIFYQNTILAFTFWLFLGLSVAGWQKPLKEKVISFKDIPELSLVFSILLIIAGLAILATYFFGVKFYLAETNYRSYLAGGDEKKLEKAAELNPYQSQYRLILARNYLNKIIVESQKPAEQINEVDLSNNIYFAITFAREATKLSPHRVAAWENLAVIYREIQAVAAGATEWGITSFEKAISLEPTNPILHTELGKLYLVAGKIDEAKEKFSRAKELMPDYIEPSIQMAFIHEYEGRIDEAVSQMEELVSFYPYNVEFIFQLGRFYLNNNQIDEAVSQFEWAITLFPNHSNSIYSLGVAYQRKGEKERAITAFGKVLELNPGNQNIIQILEELKNEETTDIVY